VINFRTYDCNVHSFVPYSMSRMLQGRVAFNLLPGGPFSLELGRPRRLAQSMHNDIIFNVCMHLCMTCLPYFPQTRSNT
jgi:hypothetical protein